MYGGEDITNDGDQYNIFYFFNYLLWWGPIPTIVITNTDGISTVLNTATVNISSNSLEMVKAA